MKIKQTIRINPNFIKVRKVFRINEHYNIIPSKKRYDRKRERKELRDELKQYQR